FLGGGCGGVFFFFIYIFCGGLLKKNSYGGPRTHPHVFYFGIRAKLSPNFFFKYPRGLGGDFSGVGMGVGIAAPGVMFTPPPGGSGGGGGHQRALSVKPFH
ncbi:hypothetical protein, partial [Enterobacter hormaechei]